MIYLLIVEDIHEEVYVQPYSTEEEAIKNFDLYIEKSTRVTDGNFENPFEELYIRYCLYDGERSSIYIIKSELDKSIKEIF